MLKLTQNLLKKLHHRPQKSKGQNYLISKKVLTRIVKTAELKTDDQVIEIGSGLGILTTELLKSAKNVQAIELDDQLIPYLKKQFKDNSKLTLHHQDALEFNKFPKKYKLVANIPYYLTSPIIRHYISENNNRPELVVFLMQKEVAKKICSNKKSVLAWQVQLFGKPKIIAKVTGNSFYPPPKVDSAILKIKLYDHPLIYDQKKFFKIIKMAFSNKRKTLANNLKSFKNIKTILRDIGLSPTIRAEELVLENWQKLISRENSCEL